MVKGCRIDTGSCQKASYKDSLKILKGKLETGTGLDRQRARQAEG